MSDVLGDVRVQRASDVLAARLRGQILTGELAVGTQLPVERELAEITGLSRTVVRDALKILSQEGLVQTRAGRNGGSVVSRPTTSSIVRSVDQYAQAGVVNIASLLEARRLIEPMCAKLAAERRDDERLARLLAAHQDVIDSRPDAAAFEAANIRWHVAVAHASGNELLASFIEGISSVMKAGTENQELSDRDRRAVVKAHERIMDAIRACDGDAAARRMQRHLVAFSEVSEAAPPAGSRRRSANG